MRIVKEAEERRNEILDVAERLFSQKGFEGTSTNEILEEIGIARGTLYYHFKSKEDIMNALIERYNKRILSAAKEVAHNQQLTVFERIIQVVLSLKISQYNENSDEFIAHIHKPQNVLMHQKIQRVIIQSITPILADLIREGITQGLFQTAFPYECVELFMVYATTLLDGDIIEVTKEEGIARMQVMLINMEKILGCEPGSLKDAIRMFQ